MWLFVRVGGLPLQTFHVDVERCRPCSRSSKAQASGLQSLEFEILIAGAWTGHEMPHVPTTFGGCTRTAIESGGPDSVVLTYKVIPDKTGGDRASRLLTDTRNHQMTEVP